MTKPIPITAPSSARLTTISLLAAILWVSGALPLYSQEQLSKKDKKKIRSQAQNLSLAFNLAAEMVRPCTVEVLSRTSQSDEVNPILRILGGEEKQDFQNFGTGVIVSPDGVILTNHHVVKDAEVTEIRLPDGRRFEVTEAQSDPRSDVAVLKVEAQDLPFAELSEQNPYVGQWVLAIGNPFMLDSSVSAGIISSTRRFRRLSSIVEGQFLQTDASVNPGNSGGPLIDLDGRVVGINTAIASRSGSFEGIGFAIPIKRANWIRKELLEHGKVRRGYAGVSTSNVAFEQIEELNLPSPSGALVRRVVPGYPAQLAGLEMFDVIIELDGQKVQTAADFASVVQQSPLGEAVPIVIIRDGERKELSIEFVERKE